MALEDNVNESESLVKFTAKAFGKSLIYPFLLHKEGFMGVPKVEGESNARSNYKAIATLTALSTGTLFSMGAIVGSPTLLTTAILTSSAGYIRDRIKNPKQKKDLVEKTETTDKSFSLPSLKEIGGSAAALAIIYAMSYAGASVASAGLKLTKDAFNPADYGRNNVIAYDCKLTVDGKDFNFVHVGEMHHYNLNSTSFAKALFDASKFDGVFHEGTGASSSTPNEERTEPAMYEKLYGVAFDTMQSGAGKTYPGFIEMALQKQIPIEFIERLESNGNRQGLNAGARSSVGAIGLIGILFKPHMELAFYGTSLGGCIEAKLTGTETNEPSTLVGKILGLLDERNELMVENFYEGIQDGEYDRPVLVTGSAHLKGMREDFRELGDFEAKRIKLDY